MHCTDGTFLSTGNFYELAPFLDMIWQKNCWPGDLLIKTCRNWSNHPNAHYILIKHFLENENFNVLIKLPFQYDMDVPFPQGKKLRFRFFCQKIVVMIFCAVSIASNCGQIADSSIKPGPTRVTVTWDEDYDFPPSPSPPQPPHHHHHHYQLHHHQISYYQMTSMLTSNENNHHIIFIIPCSS